MNRKPVTGFPCLQSATDTPQGGDPPESCLRQRRAPDSSANCIQKRPERAGNPPDVRGKTIQYSTGTEKHNFTSCIRENFMYNDLRFNNSSLFV